MIGSAQIQAYNPSNNEVQRRTKLDLVEEGREYAWVRMESYRRRIQQAFNKKVVPWSFQVGDLVLCKVNPAGEVKNLALK